MRRDIYIERADYLAALALDNGATMRAPGVVDWDCSGGCRNPAEMALRGITETDRPRNRILWEFDWDAAFQGFQRWTPPKPARVRRVYLNIQVRCRKCDHCRKARRNMWTQRAKNEYRAAARTWFGTLTIRPEVQAEYLLRAQAAAHLKSEDFDKLSGARQFRDLVQQAGPELTRYMKRVRKNSGAKLRYIAVAEPHVNMLPHWHVLLHEQTPDDMVKYRRLKTDWKVGFSTWKLVLDPKGATYVCKYLNKDAATRIRASRFYGNPPDLCIAGGLTYTRQSETAKGHRVKPVRPETSPLLASLQAGI